MKDLTFGWRANDNADGFEQSHGRFTMEVYWYAEKRTWAWAIWTGALVNGQRDQTIIAHGTHRDLDEAKREVRKQTAEYERLAMLEDKKFR